MVSSKTRKRTIGSAAGKRHGTPPAGSQTPPWAAGSAGAARQRKPATAAPNVSARSMGAAVAEEQLQRLARVSRKAVPRVANKNEGRASRSTRRSNRGSPD